MMPLEPIKQKPNIQQLLLSMDCVQVLSSTKMLIFLIQNLFMTKLSYTNFGYEISKFLQRAVIVITITSLVKMENLQLEIIAYIHCQCGCPVQYILFFEFFYYGKQSLDEAKMIYFINKTFLNLILIYLKPIRKITVVLNETKVLFNSTICAYLDKNDTYICYDSFYLF